MRHCETTPTLRSDCSLHLVAVCARPKGVPTITNRGAEAAAFMHGEEAPPAIGTRVSVASPCPLQGSVFVVQNAQTAPLRACVTQDLRPGSSRQCYSRFVCTEHW